MAALDYLGRRLSEERPQVKFTRNPSYADDVKWLFSVAAQLGLVYIQNFLQTVINRMLNPFLLHVSLAKYIDFLSSSNYNLIRDIT